MRSTTTINGREVAILPGEPIAVLFSPGSPYVGDEGVWRFWTLLGREGKLMTGRGKGEDPGARFREMEGSKENELQWAEACVAKEIRAATREEVESWLKNHPTESKFAESYEVGAITGKVVNTPAGYRLV